MESVETPGIPEPAQRFERFRLVYPSGTVVMAYYAGGALLEEVRVTHPLAVVEVEPWEQPRQYTALPGPEGKRGLPARGNSVIERGLRQTADTYKTIGDFERDYRAPNFWK